LTAKSVKMPAQGACSDSVAGKGRLFYGAEGRNFPALRLCDDWQIYDIGEKNGGLYEWRLET
jgi:hypothetical protein